MIPSLPADLVRALDEFDAGALTMTDVEDAWRLAYCVLGRPAAATGLVLALLPPAATAHDATGAVASGWPHHDRLQLLAAVVRRLREEHHAGAFTEPDGVGGELDAPTTPTDATDHDMPVVALADDAPLRALAALPTAEREVLLLDMVCGLAGEEIALVLRVSPSDVRRLHHEARGRIRALARATRRASAPDGSATSEGA